MTIQKIDIPRRFAVHIHAPSMARVLSRCLPRKAHRRLRRLWMRLGPTVMLALTIAP
jgi:hypothetical protein